MRAGKKKLKITCLAAAAVLLLAGLINILTDSRREVLAADVKDAVKVDIYLVGGGKKTFFCSLEQSNGLGFSYGEKGAAVFGEELAISGEQAEAAFRSDNGLLLRFRFKDTPFTLDARCYRVDTDEDSVIEAISSACFTDRDSFGTVFLVKMSAGICFSEPEILTKKFRDTGGCYYEILDESFFTDIKDELREEFYFDDGMQPDG